MKLDNQFVDFRVLTPGMFRTILRRQGITKTSFVLTLASILLSIAITFGVNFFLRGGPVGGGLVIAIIAPAIIAPVMSLQLLRLIRDLDQAEEKLKILSYTDELTQTYNRRYFMQLGEQELKRAQRYGEAFSVALLDIDEFKEINDKRGHLMGDRVLQKLSCLLKEEIRQSDILARYGGDEFVFLFPKTNQRQALLWVERLYARFAATSINYAMFEMWPSFSIGIATFDSTITSLDELLAKADRALYQSKERGGNTLMLG